MDLVGRSFALGESILSNRSPKQLKSLGQFLTPPVVARYLARQLSTIKDGDRILDPSIGSGVLACAVIEEIIQVYRYRDAPIELWLEGYEIDSELAQAARDMLALATEYAAMHGIILHTRVYEEDFILSHVSLGPLFGNSNSLKYDCIIANPPYFKLNKEDPRVRAVMAQSSGYTNIYTLFIAFSIEQLQPSARACFIVPRSFCSGTYFSDFREDFIEKAVPLAVHLFESRDTVFGQRNVLQENIIVTFRRRNTTEVFKKSFRVAISTSRSATNLDSLLLSRDIDTTLFLGKINGSLFFRLPISELDENILRTVDSWPGSFSKYGFKVSTGPVVAFRAKNYLTSVDDVDNGAAVPLLWMQNVQPGNIIWPVVKKNKPQG
ncbi:MAG: N-6 DNA methylase, partial [Anaerolineae bacterium]|nr:N-6 DNA methylase [Anaerolineae bacterium]